MSHRWALGAMLLLGAACERTEDARRAPGVRPPAAEVQPAGAMSASGRADGSAGPRIAYPDARPQPDAAPPDAALPPLDAGPPPMAGGCVDVRAIDWLRATIHRNGAEPLGGWAGLNDFYTDDDPNNDVPPELQAPARFERGVFTWGSHRSGERIVLAAVRATDDEGPPTQTIAYGDIDGDGCDEALLKAIECNNHLNLTFLMAIRAAPDGTLHNIGEIDGRYICGDIDRFAVDNQHRVVVEREARMRDLTDADFEPGDFQYTYNCEQVDGVTPLREETYAWRSGGKAELPRLIEQAHRRRDVTPVADAHRAP